MSKITVRSASSIYRALAQGIVGPGQNYFHIPSRLLSGAAAVVTVELQVSLLQSKALNDWLSVTGALADYPQGDLGLYFQYDWEQAPPWSNYGVLNADGSGSWFADVPMIDESRGKWVSKTFPNRNWPMHSTVRSIEGWRSSLIKRPDALPQVGDAPLTPVSATLLVETSEDDLVWSTSDTVLVDSTVSTTSTIGVPSAPYVRVSLSETTGDHPFVLVDMSFVTV